MCYLKNDFPISPNDRCFVSGKINYIMMSLKCRKILEKITPKCVEKNAKIRKENNQQILPDPTNEAIKESSAWNR